MVALAVQGISRNIILKYQSLFASSYHLEASIQLKKVNRIKCDWSKNDKWKLLPLEILCENKIIFLIFSLWLISLVFKVRGQIRLLDGGSIIFGLSDFPVSEFELVAEELLMSDSVIKACAFWYVDSLFSIFSYVEYKCFFNLVIKYWFYCRLSILWLLLVLEIVYCQFSSS